jgi:hypothetical protein
MSKYTKVIVVNGSIAERYVEFYKPKEGWGGAYFMAWDDADVRVHYGPTVTTINLKPSRNLKWYVRKHLGPGTVFQDKDGIMEFVPYPYVREEYMSRPWEERRLRMAKGSNTVSEEES